MQCSLKFLKEPKLKHYQKWKCKSSKKAKKKSSYFIEAVQFIILIKQNHTNLHFLFLSKNSLKKKKNQKRKCIQNPAIPYFVLFMNHNIYVWYEEFWCI